MKARSAELQIFLDSLRNSIAAQVPFSNPAFPMTQKVSSALSLPAERGDRASSRLPVCEHLSAALARARGQGPEAAKLADALEQIDPSLAWRRRRSSEKVDAEFDDGHANATVVGPGGIEERDDLWVGISLLAPNIQYPEHRHPPEEIYVALSPGQWRQADLPWCEPGIGGIVHNQANTLHSMRSSKEPLLAVWCLWFDAACTEVAG